MLQLDVRGKKKTQFVSLLGVLLLCTDLSQQAKQHVSVQGALMSLIHDNSAVVVQVRLPQ